MNRAQLRALTPYRNWSSAIGMAVACSALGLYAGAVAVDHLPLFPDPFFVHAQTLILEPSYYLNLIKQNWVRAIPFYLIPLTAASGAGVGAFLFFGRLIDPVIHLRGRQLWRGKEAQKRAIAASRKMLSQSEFCVEILPGVAISRDQLLKSILVCGAQGGGKTVFINQLLLKLIELNHKLVIFDPVKGDYSRWVPMSAGLCLISSTDARSLHWWLGFDLLDEADAAAFSEGLVAESSDPLWSNAARLILVGIIVHLQKTFDTNWSWSELSDCLCLTMEDLHELLKTDYPPAATFCDPESKTSQSMEKNLKAFTANITRLAYAWSKVDTKKRFSFKAWLDNDNTKHRRIIIQMNQRDAALGASISRAIISYSTNHIASLEFSESKTRMIGWFLDEVPQFRKLESLIKLNEIGRSKGVYTLVGFQDSSQISQIYDKEELQKWSALFGIRVFPQVVGADSQRWVCDQVGDREVQYRTKSVSGTGLNGVNVSASLTQPQTLPVLLPAELELFGKRKDGIEALFLGLGKDALALKIPFPQIKDIRPPHVSWPQPQIANKTHTGSGEFETESQKVANSSGSVQPRNSELETLPAHKPRVGVTPSTTLPVDEVQTDILQFYLINEPQQLEKVAEIAGEAVEEIAKSQVVEAVAEAIGIPSELIEAAELLDDLQAPLTQNYDVIDVPVASKRRARKAVKYEHENS